MVGEYHGKVPPSYLKRFYENYLLNIRYGVGQKLILRGDSTYSISFCQFMGEGKWYLEEDSVILKPSSRTVSIDTVRINPFAQKKSYFITENGVLVSTQRIEVQNSPWGDAYTSKSMLYKLE